jgi:uncharacterized lipoprotein YddW (UPF0748 family)
MKSCFYFFWGFLFFLPPVKTSSQTSPQYELRGVWIATVDNIDWPSKKTLSVEEQKSEFIHILNMHQHNGINALFVQVRPAGDAFYPSKFEPWSEFLTGKQGLAPEPFYDPLQFMIEETHKRGMEFHAWLNPYRAVFNTAKSSIASTHLTKTHPELFLTYGDKKYFNPGLPEVRQHVAAVVKDLIIRYNLDGIHMDDYFYPYKIPGKEFPDELTYKKSGSTLNKEDWRRSNCDSIIQLIHQTIIANNARIKFGISPFGVWRNKDKDAEGSNTKAGQTNYDDLYADILLWLKRGWIDYVAPQLYWERGHKLCDYDTLLKWWNNHSYDKQLFIGHALYRAGSSSAWKNATELPNEIKALRNYTTTQGSIYFSSKSFENNPNGFSDSLYYNYYALPALVPPMNWIDSIAPDKPSAEKLKNNNYRINYKGKEKIKAYAVYALPKNVDEKLSLATLIQIIIITTSDKIIFERNKSLASANDKVFIASVDWNNNVSEWIELK